MADKRLYRQVHPKHVKAGIVTSQAFKPIKSTQLSVYDGSMIDAEPAWMHFTKTGNKSAGVVAVTDVECNSQNLAVIPDPEPFKEHVIIDFDRFAPSTIKRIACILTNNAKKRGWCYRPNQP